MKTDFFDFDLFVLPDSLPLAEIAQGQGLAGVFLVLRDDPNAQELLDYLKKILAAVACDMDRDAWWTLLAPDAKFSFSQLQTESPIRLCLAFGISPASLGLNIQAPLYHPITLAGKEWLFADDLSQIYAERTQKDRPMAGALWSALQMLFKQP